AAPPAVLAANVAQSACTRSPSAMAGSWGRWRPWRSTQTATFTAPSCARRRRWRPGLVVAPAPRQRNAGPPPPCRPPPLPGRPASTALSEQGGGPLEVERPALVALDAGVDAFPAGTVAVEVAVLELDPRPVRAVGGEADLHLARLVRIRLELPGGTDVPA